MAPLFYYGTIFDLLEILFTNHLPNYFTLLYFNCIICVCFFFVTLHLLHAVTLTRTANINIGFYFDICY
jgi:hypothetical protein